jgi:cyclopropane fatty-acyl-phospholipid synthase-like methyltransferase
MSARPSWFIDETAPPGMDFRKPEVANRYDVKHGGFRDFAAESAAILDALALGPASVIIDMGAGIGAFAIHAARACRHVYAVDVSAAMLALLRRKIEAQNLSNITICEAGFLTYEHRAEAADALVSSAVLHHLPDFWKQIALMRVADMLRPFGRLFLFDVVFSFTPEDYEGEIECWLRSFSERTGVEYSTFDWILLGMIERAGFRVDHVRRDSSCTVSIVATKKQGIEDRA